MKLNSDVNVLGSLPDLNLILLFLSDSIKSLSEKGQLHASTTLKTDKSIKRFEKAISSTLLGFKSAEAEQLVGSILRAESISADSLLMVFCNASFNNELLAYLNETVYFTAFYSGRITIKQDEVLACLKELKQTEVDIQKWSDSTIEVTASKYLTLLKKFNLMEGSMNKTITHPYLNDKMLVLFVYWLVAMETKSNVLNSTWLKYSFSETPIFIDRIMQRKFAAFFHLEYTGDRLTIMPIISYENIYNALTDS